MSHSTHRRSILLAIALLAACGGADRWDVLPSDGIALPAGRLVLGELQRCRLDTMRFQAPPELAGFERLAHWIVFDSATVHADTIDGRLAYHVRRPGERLATLYQGEDAVKLAAFVERAIGRGSGTVPGC